MHNKHEIAWNNIEKELKRNKTLNNIKINYRK